MFSKSDPTMIEGLSGWDMLVFAISVCVCTAFFLSTHKLTTPRGKSWLISCLSSSILSVHGVHRLVDAIINKNFTYEHIFGGEDDLSRIFMMFFMAEMTCDILLGLIYYRKHQDVLSCYVHHIFYVWWVYYLVSHNFSRGFNFCFVMEIPTFILALGSVNAKYRNDLLFGVSFFLTRIVFHLFLIYVYGSLWYESIVWKICSLAFVLHIYWFSNWYTSYGVNYAKSMLKKD